MSTGTVIDTYAGADALVLGLTLLSTGGGGLPAWGRAYLRDLLDEGYKVSWQPVDSLTPETLTCSPFGMGSVAPREPMTSAQRRRFGVDDQVVHRPAVRAVEQLGDALGERIGAVVPFELGGFNTIVGIDAGVRLGLPVVDGDYIGRALPEMDQALPAALGLPVWPLAVCDPWGVALVLRDCPSPAVAERIGKLVSTVTKAPDMRATCAHAAFPLRAGVAAGALVPGTLTNALAVGRAIQRARDAGGDALRAATGALGGFLLFRGTVEAIDHVDERGYMIGATSLEGAGPFAGEHARLWFKNENHVFWRGGQVRATSPDVIAVVRDPVAEPVTNTELRAGDAVAVLAFPSHARYREGRPLALTEPRHYGFDLEFRPVEELNGRVP